MKTIQFLFVGASLCLSACGGQVTGAGDRAADDAGTSSSDSAGGMSDADAGAAQDAALADCDPAILGDPLRPCPLGERCRLDAPSCGYIATCVEGGWRTECVDPCPPFSADPPKEGSACKTRGLECRFGPVACDETACTCSPSGGGLAWDCLISHCR